MKTTCQYCDKLATHTITWFRGAFGKPGPVVIPYCGSCSIKGALYKRGMTAPVEEGRDYEVAKKLQTKRYSVCFFPSLYGTPWDTDSWIMAKWWAYRRYWKSGSIGEIRVIDNKTGKHYVM